MSNKDFAHIHLHSEFSFLDGMSKVWDDDHKEPSDLPKRVAEIGQKYCAVTDHGSTAGWIRFDKAMKKVGVSPIFGVEGYYCDNRLVKGADEATKLRVTRGLTVTKERNAAVRAEEKKLGLSKRSHFVALAMNADGLQEILKTTSIASTEGFYRKPRWDFELIKTMKNCIIGTACAGGILNYWYNREDLEIKDRLKMGVREAEKWRAELGDRFYIELQAIDWLQQTRYNKFCWKIAQHLGIPCYLANDSHYVTAPDWEAHDILLAISYSHGVPGKDALNDPNRLRYDMHDLYVKTRAEMAKSFLKRNSLDIYSKEDISAMLDCTVEIAERCHHSVNKKKMIMPDIPVPDFIKTDKSHTSDIDRKNYLKHLCKEGWKRKITPYVAKSEWTVYKDRLKEELGLIIGQGFTPYFIMCNGLMKWTDEKGIARGPARGSSAGSLVAYLLDITMVDPIPHKLLFSRFIDPNRTDYPDVDMDFEDWRRREIVQYFVENYGKEKVAILGNNMTFKPKMALKDVARLHGVPLWETQKICDLVVNRSGADSRLSFCIKDTFDQHEFAKEYKRKYPKVAKFAEQLEGLKKIQGVHAAGVVIADGDINQYTSLRYDKRQEDFLIATIDRYDCEDIGLLKMDILGLNTMAVLQECRVLIKERHKIWIDFEELCRDVTYKGGDKKVYKAFANANTTGIFQFNSPGLTRLSKQVKIENFDEISDCTALHRPGPIHAGAMNQYPALKSGDMEKPDPMHKIVEDETSDTYGLVIYQEQVMQIVRRLGKFDWAQTNTVRKVMSKSGGAEYFMTNFWPTFKQGCADEGLDEKTALKIFHKIMSFGSWAFNKSVSGDTLILNTNNNQFAPKWITIKQLYEQEGYATNKWRTQPRCYVKMNTLSMDSDGRLRPAKIKDVFYHGKMEVAEIVTESGCKIKITKNHRLLGVEDGEEVFALGSEIKVGSILVMNDGYERKTFIKNGEGYRWLAGKSWVDGKPPEKDKRVSEVKHFRAKMVGKPCQRCGVEWEPTERFEVHHVNRKPPNSILRWLCNSCHKIEDYELGNRVKVWSKGFPIHYERVVSKEYLGEQDTYDIEMEDSSRPTFIANGFVSHNSHSISYAFVSYFCMWMKVNYPIEFCTAYMNKVNDTDGSNVPKMVMEAQRLNIEMREPDINISKYGFVIDGNAIVSGFSKIKNVGDKAVATILENQPYSSITEFLSKINNRACNKRSVENLIKAGCFDLFGYNQGALLDNIVEIQKFVKRGNEKSLNKAIDIINEQCLGEENLTEQEIAQMKTSVSPVSVGKHITRYYDDIVEKFASNIRVTKLEDIELDDAAQANQQATDGSQIKRLDVWLTGLLTKVDLKRLSQEVKEVIDSGKEERYALANLEDGTDFIVLSFKKGVYEKYEQELFNFKGKVVLVRGTVNKGWKKCFVDTVHVMDDVRAYLAAGNKPFNYDYEYLFRHPLNRYFDKKGGVAKMKEKLGCVDLKKVRELPIGESMWTLGIISDIQTFVAKPTSKIPGQKFFWIFVEDDTFCGSFMVFPTDRRFKQMKKDLFMLYRGHMPFLLKVQRDMGFKPGDEQFKQVCISIDKREDWEDMIRMPFKRKEKK